MAEQDAERKLFEGMGRALSAWIRVEEALCLLFIALLRPENVTAAIKAFGGVINFNAKLKMVHLAAQIALAKKPDDLAEWNKIHNALVS